MSSEIVKKLQECKNEIENEKSTSLKTSRKVRQSKLCVNALTNIPYSFEVSSPEERSLYRVMPIDGTMKLYFDCPDEYHEWKRYQKRGRIGKIFNISGVQN